MTPLSPDWAPFLRKISLFAQLGEAVLTRLRDRVHPRSAPAGTVLFHQGDDSDSLIVLLAGEIRLSKIENGQDHLVTLLGRRGDTIGEMTLLNGRTRPVTARVERDAEFLVLERRDFESLLEENPALALPLARQLSEQLVQTAPVGVDRKSAVNRTYAFFAPVPGPDRVVLGVNAALSLLEQSRRRVVVIDMAERPLDRVAPALGLRGPAAAADWRAEDFSTPDGLRRHIERHASGLDVLTLPLSLFDARFTESFYPLLHALRRDWDHIVFLLEGDMGRLARALVAEVDRVLVAWDDPPSAAAGVLWRELEGVIAAPRLDRVELNGGDRIRRNRPGHFMIPWPRGTGQRVLGGGTPFLGPADARTHRGLDRMARHLTGHRIGLAMGSGAALGYSIIGILRVLERNGIYPDLISGTSMGALIGSFYAMGCTPDELEKIALSITKVKLWSMVDFSLPPWKGIVIGNGVLKFLKSVLGDATFDDLELPFACVATDINTGDERILRHGAVAEAVRASLSLPFFFQPFLHQGRYLVDGGLVNPVPSSVVRSMGADIRIGINITTKPAVKHFPGFKSRLSPLDRLIVPNVVRVMMKTLYTMQYGIAQTRAHDSNVVLAPDLSAFTWMEFHRAADIIRVGEDNAEHLLPKIKALLPFHNDQCRIPLRAPVAVRPY